MIRAGQKNLRPPPRVALLAVSSGPLEITVSSANVSVHAWDPGAGQLGSLGIATQQAPPVWTRPLILTAWSRCLQLLTWASQDAPTRAHLLVPPSVRSAWIVPQLVS